MEWEKNRKKREYLTTNKRKKKKKNAVRGTPVREDIKKKERKGLSVSRLIANS